MPAIVPAASGGARRASREHEVDARLELYAADGRLFHLFWLFLLEAAKASARAGRLIRDVPSKTLGAVVSALIGATGR